jgi:YD repeat-containing protein
MSTMFPEPSPSLFKGCAWMLAILFWLAPMPQVQAQPSFLRADSNGDGGVDISDAIFTLGYLFLGSASPGCLDALDANDDGSIDISDVIFTLAYLFLGTGAPPPPPGPHQPGPDPTPDAIGCGPAAEQAPYEPPFDPPAAPTRLTGKTKWPNIVLKTGYTKLRVIHIRGRGLDFEWVLTYRSRNGLDTPQGIGWDHGYNVRIEREGPSSAGPIRLFNGTGRSDVFTAGAAGVYTAPEFFLEGREGAGGTFTFTFPDTGKWLFRALDGSPAQGKLERIEDRNGNAITLEYDPAGRLVTVRDAVGRPVTVAYNEEGRIAGLTDFTGRRFNFAYYRQGEAGGSPGDLRSVDFGPLTVGDSPPLARSVSFTYTSGHADERLNHNLLTATDGRGVVLQRYEYSTATDPADPSFDRPIRMQRTGPLRDIPPTADAGLDRQYLVVVSPADAGLDRMQPFDPLLLDLRGDGLDKSSPTGGGSEEPLEDVDLPGVHRTALARVLDDAQDVSRLRPGYQRGKRGKGMLGRVLDDAQAWLIADAVGRGIRTAGAKNLEHASIKIEENISRGIRTALARFLDDVQEPLVHTYSGRAAGRWMRNSPQGEGSLRQHRSGVVGEATPLGEDSKAWRRKAAWEARPAPREALLGVRLTLPPKAKASPNMWRQTTPPKATSFAIHWTQRSTGDGIVATLNDGVGNVSEETFDLRNRLVHLKEFTGRARPGVPVTPNENRPAGKLRPKDPDFYEMTFEYNDDSLLTCAVFPRGNSVELEYQRTGTVAHGSWRGNLEAIRRKSDGITSSQPEIIENKRYHADFNLVTSEVDGRGNETRYEYDAEGNLVRAIHAIPTIVEDFEYNDHGQLTRHIHPDNGSGGRRVDAYSYSEATGYLTRHSWSADSDGDGVEDAASFEHDAVGNLIKINDPRTVSHEFAYNALDELVRGALGGLASSPGGAAHIIVWDFERDLGGNLTRVDVRNADENGALYPNSHLTTFYEYDDQNRLAHVREELGDFPLGPGEPLDPSTLPLDQFVTTEYEYDPNGNLSLVRSGEAVRGGDPHNAVRFAYDERNLLLRVSRGEGSRDQATDQYDYDENGNLFLLAAGLEQPGGASLCFAHDGHDRPVSVLDAMGNTREITYDASGNLLSLVVRGELLDAEGDAANVELERTERTYDAMDRCVRVDRVLAAADPPPASDSRSITQLFWSDAGGLIRLVDPNQNETRWAYDAAGRVSRRVDALGNETSLEYDPGSNVVQVTLLEKQPRGESVHVYSYERDALGRVVRAEDQAGNAESLAYDSRSNLVQVTDGEGNPTRYEYDALSRPVTVLRFLPDPRTGAVDMTPYRRQRWDHASRCVETTDANGNATRYAYDSLDRCLSMTLADGTVHAAKYNVFDELVETTDANGTLTVRGYDKLHRLVRVRVTPADGVSRDTTFEDFAYDGLGRLVRAADDDSLVTFEYDQLSRLTRETLNGKATAYTHDLAGNVTSVTSPGGRRVTYTYDAIHRVSTMAAGAFGGPSAAAAVSSLRWSYAGRGRIVRVDRGNHTEASFDYDEVLRPVRSMEWFFDKGIARLLEDRAYGWDAAYRKVSRRSHLPDGLEQAWGYDGADRLARSTFGIGGAPPNTITYTLDLAGNRVTVEGGPDAGAYGMDPTLPEPADLQVNQYTSTPFDTRIYDKNGSMIGIQSGAKTSTAQGYDFRGRLVLAADPATGDGAAYSYDALGRLICFNELSKGVVRNIRARHFAGPNAIEEEDGMGNAVAFSDFADGLHPVGRGSGDLDGDGLLDLYYYLTDDAGNTTALTDAAGNVVERYEYGDFGRPRITDAAGSLIEQSRFDNPYLLAGSLFDPVTGWYLDGEALMDPGTGRRVWLHTTIRGYRTGAGKVLFDPVTGWYLDGEALMDPGTGWRVHLRTTLFGYRTFPGK